MIGDAEGTLSGNGERAQVAMDNPAIQKALP
jgi:hypothetical protein